jgi:hypothetical protein
VTEYKLLGRGTIFLGGDNHEKEAQRIAAALGTIAIRKDFRKNKSFFGKVLDFFFNRA